ncbi:Maf family protein [Ancylobacter pratisalsi]|uniref:Nucleoside triphosphate pyrophosphatase n=1 Tax=Ancylobacter pratisalsi TaxID=1745854 RepID=A0A6P1YTL6_9HYPH|nr:Maf family protein [Ancylobacter pratisalsi]QIB36191.1 septum formation inhibitor Maf [Ancylobacter pratisalsi]
MLASKSAARRTLLESARLPVETIAVEVDERRLEAEAEAVAEGADPPTVAAVLAQAKARAGSASYPGRLVLGADQTLALGGEAFHKPASLQGARTQIARLSGRTHALHSAIAVAQDGAIVFETVETAHLTMRPLAEEAIDAYLAAAGDAVLSSVGGYQLEALGIHLFERVEGDHAVILGLPLLPLLAFLRRHGDLI